MHIPYSGNYHIFRKLPVVRKLKPTKFYSRRTCVKFCNGSLSILQASYCLPNPLASFIVAGLRHFDNEPFAKGSLSKCLSLATIKDANEVVKNSPKPAKSRSTYAKLTPKKQAQYVVFHGNKAAIHHFPQELGFGIKESSVSAWKSKYQAELKRVSASGNIDDVSVKRLPVKRRGRPLLLGEKLDTEVNSYIQAVREAGGVITTSITIAAAIQLLFKEVTGIFCQRMVVQ